MYTLFYFMCSLLYSFLLSSLLIIIIISLYSLLFFEKSISILHHQIHYFFHLSITQIYHLLISLHSCKNTFENEYFAHANLQKPLSQFGVYLTLMKFFILNYLIFIMDSYQRVFVLELDKLTMITILIIIIIFVATFSTALKKYIHSFSSKQHFVFLLLLSYIHLNQ